MSQFKIGFMVFCGFAALLGYRYVTGVIDANTQLRKDILSLEVTVAEKAGQVEAKQIEIEDYKGRLVESAQERAALDVGLQEARERAEYMKGVFADHEFSKLLEKKPGRIGRRMRDATRRVFLDFEQASRGVNRDGKAGGNLPKRTGSGSDVPAESGAASSP